MTALFRYNQSPSQSNKLSLNSNRPSLHSKNSIMRRSKNDMYLDCVPSSQSNEFKEDSAAAFQIIKNINKENDDNRDKKGIGKFFGSLSGSPGKNSRIKDADNSNNNKSSDPKENKNLICLSESERQLIQQKLRARTQVLEEKINTFNAGLGNTPSKTSPSGQSGKDNEPGPASFRRNSLVIVQDFAAKKINKRRLKKEKKQAEMEEDVYSQCNFTSSSIPTSIKIESMIQDFMGLSKVYLSEMNLRWLPDSFERLQTLETLALDQNRFKSIPKQVTRLRNLRCLYINDNKVQEIPCHIRDLVNLRYLWVQKNRIPDLPYHLVTLPSLRYLHAENNCIEILPESISEAIELRGLLGCVNYFAFSIYSQKGS